MTCATRLVLLLALPLLQAASPSAAERMVSWWYAADPSDYRQAVDLIAPHASVVSSVMTYCNYEVADNGTIIGDLGDVCPLFFPLLASLGVKHELILNAGNCSIDAYRTLWSDTTVSPAWMLREALAANASGWNIDLEPQGDNCQGSGTGNAQDAALFASWLAAVRKVLAPAGIRLTVDVADWSPVLAHYAILGPAVDRLLDMETYNARSLQQWTGYFDNIINSGAPVDSVGIGLGCWLDSSTNNTWATTPDSATERVNAALQANVQELAMFRIYPNSNPSWPLDFWWDALQAFVQG